MSQQDMDLLLWLHAEAVWQREQETARASAEGQAADRYRDDSELALWLYAESEWKRSCVEASRRDWAAEAERVDPPLATEDEVGDIVAEFGNLNTFLTEQVTEKLFEFYDIRPKPTGQAEAPGRYVCACLTPEGAAQVLSTGRFSLPRCAVHPEADRAGEVDRG